MLHSDSVRGMEPERFETRTSNKDIRKGNMSSEQNA